MFTADQVEELFRKHERPGERWIFEPNYGNPADSYRYAITFIPAERRFTLSRQKIERFVPVDDADLLAAFRENLSEFEIAACMRASLKPPPPDDDIPF